MGAPRKCWTFPEVTKAKKYAKVIANPRTPKKKRAAAASALTRLAKTRRSCFL